MNKRTIRWIAAICALLLCLFLVGCTAQEQQTVDLPGGWNMQPMKMQGEAVPESVWQYVRGDWAYYPVIQVDTSTWTESWQVMRSSLTSGKTEMVYAFPAGIFPANLFVTREGDLWLIMPGEASVRRISPSGEEIEPLDLSGAMEEGEMLYQVIRTDRGTWLTLVEQRQEMRDGVRYIISSYHCRLADPAGKAVCSLDVPEDVGIGNWILLSDGRAALRIGDRLRIPDPDKGSWGEEIDLSGLSEETELYSSEGDCLFLAADGSELYGYYGETGFVRLLDWEARGIVWKHTPAVLMRADGTLAAANAEERYMVRMIPCSPEEEVKRTPLVLAGIYIDEAYRQAAVEFNKYNPAWLITVKDYAEGESEAGTATRFNTELLSGQVPDILYPGNTVSVSALIHSGVLTDLYPLLDGDPDFSREDLLPEVLAAGETEGKLYQIASGFELETLLGDEKAVGTAAGFTWDRLEDILRRYPERRLFTEDTAREAILNVYLARCGTLPVIDWKTGTCDFDTPVYRGMMEVAKALPTANELAISQTEGQKDTNYDPLVSGDALLQRVTMSDVQQYRRALTRLGEDAAFVGYPGKENGTAYLLTGSSLAITDRCQNKAGAWAFLKWCLLEAAHKRSFSSLRSEFEKELAAGAEEAVGPFGEPILDRGRPLTPMTETDVAALRELIREAEPATRYDVEIAAIIQEEIAKYFSDKCTLDQAVSAIQSRVSVYVAEQR